MSDHLNESFPDVEIYIKDPELDSILAWLGTVFDSLDSQQNKKTDKVTLTLSLGSDHIEAKLIPNVVKGNFASLWFNSADTPWQTDRDCALSASDFLHKEIRCSTGTWSSNEADDDGEENLWLKFDADGESTISWNT
ncbi:MAG: hypothetical protein VB957_01170 [Pseudomonadales bacterium]